MVESLSQPVPAGSIIPAGSPKDKRLAVKALLAAPRPLPDVEIARKCGVSSATVSRCRKELGSKGVQVTSDALSKRSEVNALFTDAADLSNAEIARRVGIDPATVGRYRRLFIEQGVEWVFGDGRKNSGRRTVYDKAYTRLEELKKLHPRRGGRDLWVMLTDGEGWPEEEVPSIARI